MTTAGGETLEGYLRWDRNEASWSDFLDGLKELPWQNLAEAEELDPEQRRRRDREHSIEAFGIRISWDHDDDDADPVNVMSGVRFGHLESLVVLDDRRARLRLKSGEEVVLRASSTDLGRAMRRLLIDEGASEVGLRWRDIDRVEFMGAPDGSAAPRDERIHGTVTTRSGAEITGYVAWDLDEAFLSDVLDGEEGDGRVERAIAFGSIAAIEYESRRSARVVLRSGEALYLRGTNDVDEDNRGIEVNDPGFGRAIVPWDAFERLELHAPTDGTGAYADFDGGVPLFGVVRTRGGRELAGWIRWDNDEQEGWELLDGRNAGVEYDVELSSIRAIDRLDSRRVEVTLLDGRVLELSGSNDVDDGNKGVFVTPDGGETEMVPWRDFERVTFEW